MAVITKITTQKKAGRYNVDLDGQFAFGVSETVLVKYGLSKGREVDETLIDQIKADDAVAQALQIALHYLNSSLRTVAQVRRRLMEKNIEPTTQGQVITQLVEQGYLNDCEYAQHYLATKKNINPKGPIVIARELQQAGVAAELVTQTLLNYSDEEQLAVAGQLLTKANHSYRRESSRVRKQKLIQGLVNKGFSFGLAEQAISQVDWENDSEQERDNIQKLAVKLNQRYRNDTDSKRQYRVRGQLFAKGYSVELIDWVMTSLD